MAFVISYSLSALSHDFTQRADSLEAYYMICLSYTSIQEITDLYQNV